MRVRLGQVLEHTDERLSIGRRFDCEGKYHYGSFIEYEDDYNAYRVTTAFPELLNEGVDTIEIEKYTSAFDETKEYSYLAISLSPITVSKEIFERIVKGCLHVRLYDFLGGKLKDGSDNK